MKHERMRRFFWVKNAAALIMGLAAGFLVCEGILFSCRIAALSAAQRRSPGAASNDAELRILCIGDSVTFGGGCPEPEKSYPYLLQPLLEKALGKKVAVVNKGIPGSSTPTQLKVFSSEAQSGRYDAAIFLFGAGFWSTAEFAPDLLKVVDPGTRIIVAADSFLSRSLTYRLAKNACSGAAHPMFLKPRTRPPDPPLECRNCLARLSEFRRGQTDPAADPATARALEETFAGCIASCPGRDEPYTMLLDIFGGRGHARLAPEIADSFRRQGKRFAFAKNGSLAELERAIALIKKKQIRQMVRVCVAHRIRPIFLTYPSGTPYGYGLDEFIARLARENGYPFIDLGDYFRNTLRCARCKDYFDDDIHPNCRGYEQMAGRIAQVLTWEYARNDL